MTQGKETVSLLREVPEENRHSLKLKEGNCKQADELLSATPSDVSGDLVQIEVVSKSFF